MENTESQQWNVLEVAGMKNESGQPQGERLQSYLAHCGVSSRRAAADIALEGRVSINGSVVTERGARVLPGDVVMVDGLVVTPEQVKRYVLLNKKAGYVSSSADEKGRPVAADLLRDSYTERLYSVGRLDMYSTGLLIFTNDGEFAKRLSHPSSQLEKEYIVQTSTPIPRTLGQDFMHGIRISNVFYRCARAEEINAHKMRIVLVEGKNREIRRVFAAYEVGIKSLARVRIGPITDEGLDLGQFRDLSCEEVRMLLANC